MSSRNFVAVAFLVGGAILAASPPLFAQVNDGKAALAQSGTSEENAACRRDTRKLCRHIKAGSGDQAFLRCLQERRAKLSAGCRQALESHGM